MCAYVCFNWTFQLCVDCSFISNRISTPFERHAVAFIKVIAILSYFNENLIYSTKINKRSSCLFIYFYYENKNKMKHMVVSQI